MNTEDRRKVLTHLPWLAPGGMFAPGLRLRITREMRVDRTSLLGVGPYGPSWETWPTVLPPGTVLRFDHVSPGYEDPCSWIGPEAPVFEIEGTQGRLVGFYLDFADDASVQEALSIEVLDRVASVART